MSVSTLGSIPIAPACVEGQILEHVTEIKFLKSERRGENRIWTQITKYVHAVGVNFQIWQSPQEK